MRERRHPEFSLKAECWNFESEGQAQSQGCCHSDFDDPPENGPIHPFPALMGLKFILIATMVQLIKARRLPMVVPSFVTRMATRNPAIPETVPAAIRDARYRALQYDTQRSSCMAWSTPP